MEARLEYGRMIVHVSKLAGGRNSWGYISSLTRACSKFVYRGRNVFVKFTKLTNLTTGSTIVFYVSREKMLVGEGRVKVIEKLNPALAWSRYGDRIFLDKEEFDSYIEILPITREERRMRKLDVFVLDKVKKYGKPFRSIYPVTASGRYLTTEMVDKIRQLSVS